MKEIIITGGIGVLGIFVAIGFLIAIPWIGNFISLQWDKAEKWACTERGLDYKIETTVLSPIGYVVCVASE